MTFWLNHRSWTLGSKSSPQFPTSRKPGTRLWEQGATTMSSRWPFLSEVIFVHKSPDKLLLNPIVSLFRQFVIGFAGGRTTL